jgi:hypothetical protein
VLLTKAPQAPDPPQENELGNKIAVAVEVPSGAVTADVLVVILPPPQYPYHEVPPICSEYGIRFVVLTVLTLPVPILTPPSSNVTVPVGVPPPVFTKLEKVTDCPNVVGFVFELTCDTVAAALTTTVWVTCGAAL